MKIAALRERATSETRTAITPDTVKEFLRKNYQVTLEKSIGEKAGFSDEEYIKAGAKISSVPLEIVSDSDIILKVQPSPLVDQINEVELAKQEAVIVGLFSSVSHKDYISRAKERNLRVISLELLPRISRAQNMDALSSQSNLAGYRAVIEASYYSLKAMPMLMTAAGTIANSKVLVLGAGVAGLQAIATAKRLGGIVSAYDIRSAAKEQVQSLGAKFVYPSELSGLEQKTVYAQELNLNAQSLQDKFFAEIIPTFDIIITTAQIPGKVAPVLIKGHMLTNAKKGVVIVDMATATGGNVEGSVIDKVVNNGNVTIIGWSNMASRIPYDSSRLYAKNLFNFVDHAVKNNSIDYTDELVKQMLQ